MNVNAVLQEAAEFEWLPNHPAGGEAGPTEDLAETLVRLKKKASGDHEAKLRVSQLALIERELAVLHEDIGAVAQAEGVDLHGITGSEASCSPSALSALSGRPTDECGDALEREATRFAGCLRLEADEFRVRALFLRNLSTTLAQRVSGFSERFLLSWRWAC